MSNIQILFCHNVLHNQLYNTDLQIKKRIVVFEADNVLRTNLWYRYICFKHNRSEIVFSKTIYHNRSLISFSSSCDICTGNKALI